MHRLTGWWGAWSIACRVGVGLQDKGIGCGEAPVQALGPSPEKDPPAWGGVLVGHYWLSAYRHLAWGGAPIWLEVASPRGSRWWWWGLLSSVGCDWG